MMDFSSSSYSTYLKMVRDLGQASMESTESTTNVHVLNTGRFSTTRQPQLAATA